MVLAGGRLTARRVVHVVALRLVPAVELLLGLHHEVRLRLVRVERHRHRRLLVELGWARRRMALGAPLRALPLVHGLRARRVVRHRTDLGHTLTLRHKAWCLVERCCLLVEVRTCIAEELWVLLNISRSRSSRLWLLVALALDWC